MMNAPAQLSDASDLPSVIERARALFSDGDVLKARLVAAAAGAEAKAQADIAARFGASQELVMKARRLQGDALLIESRCSIRMVDDYEAAQERGEAAKRGRPKKDAPASILQLGETGLTKQEIAEARRLRDAERGEPGIVERAIAARVAQGLEPTRRNLRHAIGTRSASKEDRGDNLYETPIEAMRTLLALEAFSPTVLEPACGRGAILRPLEDAGYDVRIADLVDRGTATKDGEIQAVGDFLGMPATEGKPDIVTNPPYGGVMNGFIAHALREHRPRRMALLLNLNVLAGFDDPDRNFFMDEWPPARIWVFKRRLPMMHRDGWTGPTASSQMNTAWLVWEKTNGYRHSQRPYGAETRIRRVDWQDYQDAAPLPPEGVS